MVPYVGEKDVVSVFQDLSLNPVPVFASFGSRKVKVVENVHQDDIHALIRLSDDTWVTGSKDGSLKKWNFEGKLIKNIMNPGRIDYTNWITALAPHGEDAWLSGTRNGIISLWGHEGIQKEQWGTGFTSSKSEQDPACKERNTHRVNCLSSFIPYSQKPLFFAGWPRCFTLHSSIEQNSSSLCSTRTSQNDWVYAVQPLKENSLLVVTGCRLDRWVCSESPLSLWKKKESFVEEGKRQSKRPFISTMTPLQEAPSHYGLAVFDGSVRVLDIGNKKTVFFAQEHKERVWTIENITAQCFASCGDDGFIKLWDIRQPPKAIITLQDNTKEKARVSVLLSVKEHLLVSGSCPDQVRKSATKAQFSFWDTRVV